MFSSKSIVAYQAGTPIPIYIQGVPPVLGNPAWGDISGDISDQADLVEALDDKLTVSDDPAWLANSKYYAGESFAVGNIEVEGTARIYKGRNYPPNFWGPALSLDQANYTGGLIFDIPAGTTAGHAKFTRYGAVTGYEFDVAPYVGANPLYHAGNLAVFTPTAKGLVPPSGGGSGKYLRADGVFAIPPLGPPVGSGTILWGGITGYLPDQTDLKAALDLKANLAGGNVFTGDQYFNGSAFDVLSPNVYFGPNSGAAADLSITYNCTNYYLGETWQSWRTGSAVPIARRLVSDIVNGIRTDAYGHYFRSLAGVEMLRVDISGTVVTSDYGLTVTGPSAGVGANGAITIMPSGTGIYSILNMRGTGPDNALGLNINAGQGAAWFATDTFVFRNAAQTVSFSQFDANQATFYQPAIAMGRTSGAAADLVVNHYCTNYYFFDHWTSYRTGSPVPFAHRQIHGGGVNMQAPAHAFQNLAGDTNFAVIQADGSYFYQGGVQQLNVHNGGISVHSPSTQFYGQVTGGPEDVSVFFDTTNVYNFLYFRQWNGTAYHIHARILGYEGDGLWLGGYPAINLYTGSDAAQVRAAYFGNDQIVFYRNAYIFGNSSSPIVGGENQTLTLNSTAAYCSILLEYWAPDGSVNVHTGSLVGYHGYGTFLTGNPNLHLRCGTDVVDAVVISELTSTTALVAVSGKLTVDDEAYSSAWNGKLEVPTKNAIFDKVGALMRTTEETDTRTTALIAALSARIAALEARQ